MPSAQALEREYQLEREDALERARNGLLNFICYTKPDYELNWHSRVICQQMNRLISGEIKRLMVMAPPRHGKSEIISRRLPAYILGRDPDCQIISASYGAKLAQRMNRDVQRIITSPLYRDLFPETRLSEKNAKGSWQRNSEMFEVPGYNGYYLCAGIGGGLVGAGGDFALVDDPVKSWKEAYSPTFRQNVWEWYTSVLYTRLSKVGRVCLTLTRWHDDDLAGRLLALQEADPDADQWTVVHLPAINEDGPSEMDPRQVGEALWPARFPLARLDKARRNSSTVFLANYQNKPRAEGGNVIKDAWWRYYDELPDDLEAWIISVDGTFKDNEKSDYFAAQVWAKKGSDKYLVDQVHKRLAYVAQKKALVDIYRRYPQCTTVCLEDAALASALKQDLDPIIPGIVLVRAVGSKLSRAEAIAPQIEAGNIHIPNIKQKHWVDGYIAEWGTFPNGAHDDQVDATTQAITRLTDAVAYDWLPESFPKVSNWL